MSLCICGFCIPYSVLWPALLFVLKQIWDFIRGAKKEEKPQHNGAKTRLNVEVEQVTKKSDYEGYLGDLQSMEQFQTLLQNSEQSEALMIMKFTASWCKPCKALVPVFEKIVSENREKLYAVSVDVDDFDELAARYHAVLLPMMVAIHRGQQIDVYRGKEEAGLRQFIASLDVSKKNK